MSNLFFRKAIASDAARLTEIAIASKGHWGYSEELLQLWQSELSFTPENIASRLVSVAELDSGAIGVSALKPMDDYVEIEDFWLHPDHIGKGHGRALMSHTISLAERAGFRILRAAADPNAADFYRHMGAIQIGWRASTPAGRMLPVMEIKTACSDIV